MDENSLPPPFAGLSSHRDTQRSIFLHPISLMSFGIRSLPDDLALEASDTLTLYQTLAKHAAPKCGALDPKVFFHSEDEPSLLVQKDVIAYERALKKELIPLLQAGTGSDGIVTPSDIIRDLQDPKIRSLKDANMPPSREGFTKNLTFLLADLHLRGELVSLHMCFIQNRIIQIFSPQYCSISIARTVKFWRKNLFRRSKQRRINGAMKTRSGKNRFASGKSGHGAPRIESA